MVGVRRGGKQETRWVPDGYLLVIAWVSALQEHSWEAMGLLCSCDTSVGLRRQMLRSARFLP